jgi:paraquat-inducible protein A
MTSAASKLIIGCDACGLAQAISPAGQEMQCTRCGSELRLRKPNSITRTWALVIAAYVLIIPANLMPVMATGSLFGTEYDTIFGGVLFLWDSNSQFLALILFCASIVIPFAKLFSLTFLLISVQRRSTWRPVFRAKLYRIVEFIGRWSMIDVYVATMLTALVQFGNLMSIRAGMGAIAFATVVVLTIFAARSFDPRLIWDNARPIPSNNKKLAKEIHV